MINNLKNVLILFFIFLSIDVRANPNDFLLFKDEKSRSTIHSVSIESEEKKIPQDNSTPLKKASDHKPFFVEIIFYTQKPRGKLEEESLYDADTILHKGYLTVQAYKKMEDFIKEKHINANEDKKFYHYKTFGFPLKDKDGAYRGGCLAAWIINKKNPESKKYLYISSFVSLFDEKNLKKSKKRAKTFKNFIEILNRRQISSEGKNANAFEKASTSVFDSAIQMVSKLKKLHNYTKSDEEVSNNLENVWTNFWAYKAGYKNLETEFTY